MNVISTKLPGVLLLEPQVFQDERGFFLESYNMDKFNKAVGRDVCFVQDNHSKSKKNILRGLHYQVVKPQGKLVRVVSGEVYDVAVDMREDSPCYGQWFGVHLSAENKKQLWVPEGFAHGFLVLSEEAEFLYKTTDFYAPEYERSVIWNDADLSIDWPYLGQTPELSEKDKVATTFACAEKF